MQLQETCRIRPALMSCQSKCTVPRNDEVRAVNEKVPPHIGPNKGIGKELNYFFLKRNTVQRLRFLAFSEGPGGFREVREAGRNHFHLSWYLIVPGSR